ncbi:MAG: hypothetical protein AB1641_20485 [Thermodesulfobacteriota bacterium]
MKKSALVLAGLLLLTGTVWAQMPGPGPGQPPAGGSGGQMPGGPGGMMPGGPGGQMPGRPGGPPQGQGMPGDESGQADFQREGLIPPTALLRLDLSHEQRERLCREALGHMAKLNLLRAELMNKRLEMVCQQSREEVNAAKIKEAYAKMAEIEAEIFLAGEAYQKAVRTILTEEQMQQLEQTMPGRKFIRRKK